MRTRSVAVERWVAAGAALMFLGSGGWHAWRDAGEFAAPASPARVRLLTREATADAAETAEWPRGWASGSAERERGTGAAELFSPPASAPGGMIATSAPRPGEEDASPTDDSAAAGESAAIPVPALRLGGWLATGSGWVVVIEDPGAGEFDLVRPGERVGDRGWRLLGFEETTRSAGRELTGAEFGPVARAVVADLVGQVRWTLGADGTVALHGQSREPLRSRVTSSASGAEGGGR